jgi:hypothetical protein
MLGLLPAFELYENDIYRALVKQLAIRGELAPWIVGISLGIVGHLAFPEQLALGLGAPDICLSANSGTKADIAGGRRRATAALRKHRLIHFVLPLRSVLEFH